MKSEFKAGKINLKINPQYDSVDGSEDDNGVTLTIADNRFKKKLIKKSTYWNQYDDFYKIINKYRRQLEKSIEKSNESLNDLNKIQGEYSTESAMRTIRRLVYLKAQEFEEKEKKRIKREEKKRINQEKQN